MQLFANFMNKYSNNNRKNKTSHFEMETFYFIMKNISLSSIAATPLKGVGMVAQKAEIFGNIKKKHVTTN